MSAKAVRADFGGLDKFVKGLQSPFVVRVGIMGKKGARTEKGQAKTNAEIGFTHEFGTNRIPKRSFLRMPLFANEEGILRSVQSAGALRKLKDGKMIEVLADLGIACENAILRAFDSRGFGSWAANRPSTIRRKGSSAPLIDTGQLRRSISSAVVGKDG